MQSFKLNSKSHQADSPSSVWILHSFDLVPVPFSVLLLDGDLVFCTGNSGPTHVSLYPRFFSSISNFLIFFFTRLAVMSPVLPSVTSPCTMIFVIKHAKDNWAETRKHHLLPHS